MSSHGMNLLPLLTPQMDSGRRTTYYDWGHIEWLLDDALHPGVGMSFARMIVQAGQDTPLHRHPNCHEMVHLVQGQAEVMIDQTCYGLAPGSSVFIPQGAAHRTLAFGKKAAMFLVWYSSGTRLYEALPTS